MVNLTQYLSESDILVVRRALDYITTTYDVGDDRSRQALASVIEKAGAAPGQPIAVSTFELYCTMRVMQAFLADMDAAEGQEEVVGSANTALVKLVYAGTRGASFSVDNAGPPPGDWE